MNDIVAEAAGWPRWLVCLSDLLSEGLPAGEREQFHADLRQAVPAGVDLDPIKYHIAIARHERSIARLAGNTEPYAQQCVDALKGAIDWCRAERSGTSSNDLRSAVESAAAMAVEAAWEAAESAESAEWSAVRSAEWAALSAGWSALSARSAMAAARSALLAARSAEESAVHAEYRAERDALLSALRSMQRTSDGGAA